MKQILFVFSLMLAVDSLLADDVVTLASAKHQATRDSYKSTYGEVEFQVNFADEKEKPQLSKGKFWHTPASIRGIVEADGNRTDFVNNDLIQTHIHHAMVNNSSKATAGRRKLASRYSNRCDVWLRALLVINVPETGHGLEFEKLLQMSDTATGKKISRDGTEYIQVTLNFAANEQRKTDWSVVVLFDPRLHYLIREVTHSSNRPQGKIMRTERIEEVIEPQPGKPFPTVITGSYVVDGKPRSSSKTTFSKISINKTPDSSVFRLNFPHGVVLSDLVTGKKHKVNSSGDAIGASTPVSTRRVNAIPDVVQSDAIPWSTLFLYTTASIILLALVVWIVYYFRKVRNSATL